MTTDRIPIAHSVVYAVRGVPEVPDDYNAERTIAPHEISLTYRTTEDSQLGRVHAYVKGWWMQDGARVPMDKPVGRHFWGRNFADWPEWLAEEARLHDPERTAVEPPADRAALRDRIAEALDNAHRTHPCPVTGDQIWSGCVHYDDAGRVVGVGSCHSERRADAVLAVLPQPVSRADVLPAWEAVYEPGNVSDYLIGYANDQDPATGMAEAWLRSQAEVTGRLEWVDDKQMASGRYDRWFELIERHDDGVDTGPGIIVRRRMADEAQTECSASRTGHCLREAESETACDTEAGECVHGGRPADEAQPGTEAPVGGLRCVCGDPVQLMDDSEPTSWTHSPGSDTRCLEARPRCPHCQLPHAMTRGGQLMCASIRASIHDRDAAGAQQHGARS